MGILADLEQSVPQGNKQGFSLSNFESYLDQKLAEGPPPTMMENVLHHAGVAGKTMTELGVGALSWIPSQLGKIGYTALQETGRALAGPAAEGKVIDINAPPALGKETARSYGQLRQIEKLTDEQIRDRSEGVEAGIATGIPMLFGIPVAFDDPTVRHQVDTVSKILEKGLGWATDVKNAAITSTGSETVGDIAKFLAELAAFNFAHSTGKNALTKLRVLKNKANRGALTEDAVNKALDDALGTQLRTPAERQAYIDSVRDSDFANIGRTKNTDIGRPVNITTQKRIDAKREKAGFVPEEEARKIRAAQTAVKDAYKSYEAKRNAELNKPTIETRQRDSYGNYVKRPADDQGTLTPPNIETVAELAPVSPEKPAKPRGQAAMEFYEKVRREQRLAKRDGDTAAEKFNDNVDGVNIRFDGEWDPGYGFPKKYSFTVIGGEYNGRSFNSPTMAVADIHKSLSEMPGIEIGAIKDASPKMAQLDALRGAEAKGTRPEKWKHPDEELPVETTPETLESTPTTPKSDNYVHKMNVEQPEPVAAKPVEAPTIKAEKKGATPIDLDRLPDWVEIKLEEIYKGGTPELKGNWSRMKTIAKQLLETGELSTPGYVKTFKRWYKAMKEEGEAAEQPTNFMVDPEVGRPPGGFTAPDKPVIPNDYNLRQEILGQGSLIKDDRGNVIKQKAFAEAYLEKRGIEGKLVKSGEGWRVRRSKREKEKFEQELRDAYEQQLKEEGLGEIDEPTEITKDLLDIIGDESGQLEIDFERLRMVGERLKRRYGFAPKAGSLLNKFKKEMKHDDIAQLGLEGYLLEQKPQDRIEWKDLLEKVGNKGVIKKEVLVEDSAYYAPANGRWEEITLPYAEPGSSGNIAGKTYREVLYKRPDEAVEGSFKEEHFGGRGKNVFADRRSHDRSVLAYDGRKNTVHLDEIQSNWIERGKQEGFSKFAKSDRKAITDRLRVLSREREQANTEFYDTFKYPDNIIKFMDGVEEFYPDVFQYIYQILMDPIGVSRIAGTRSDLFIRLGKFYETGDISNLHYFNPQDARILVGTVSIKIGDMSIPDRYKSSNTMVLADALNSFRREQAAIREYHTLANSIKESVPETPYKQDWYKIVFRDAVQEAITMQKDGVSWNTADILKDRYKRDLQLYKTVYDTQLVKFAKQEYGVTPEKVNTVIEAGSSWKYTDPTDGPITVETPPIMEKVWYMPFTDKVKAMFETDYGRPEYQIHGRGPIRDIVEGGDRISRGLAIFDSIRSERGEVKIDLEKLGLSGILRLLKDKSGEVRIGPRETKKLRELAQKIDYKELVKGLVARGMPEKDAVSIFEKAAKQTIANNESKWFKKGDNPNEELPQRKKPGGSYAPAVTRGEAHTIAKIIDSAKIVGHHLSFENPIRTMERLGGDIKELFYRPVKQAEGNSMKEYKKVWKPKIKELKNMVSYSSRKRIGVYAISQQRNGAAVLEQQGIYKVPKLTETEMKVYNEIRKSFREFYDRINEARDKAGLGRMPAEENYFTWIQELNWLGEADGISLYTDWRTIESKYAEHSSTHPFRFAKHRAGPDKPRKLVLDPFEVFDIYSKSATEFIHKGPVLAKLHELLLTRFGMEHGAPKAYNFLRHWVDFQAKQMPAWEIPDIKISLPFTSREIPVRPLMRELSNNIVMAMLAYNVRSALIQPSALINSFTEVGRYMPMGVTEAISPKLFSEAMDKSNVLVGRSFETAVQDIRSASGASAFRLAQKKIGNWGTVPLEALDRFTAVATWRAAYRRAKAKGMKETAAINYADDIVVKTQASAAKSDIAPVQRTTLGRTITSLQTFVINNWGFITRDVLGFKNPGMATPEKANKIVKLIIATTLVNMFYEDVIGVKSPNPTPVRAMSEAYEEASSQGLTKAEQVAKVMAAGGNELIEYVPMIGGALRYGGSIGGPAASIITDFYKKKDMKSLLALLGMPGNNAFWKGHKAYERNGTLADIILGRYLEPVKKSGRRKRSTSSRPRR